MEKQQHLFREDKEKRQELTKLWLLMIEKVNSFENICFANKQLNKLASEIKSRPDVDISDAKSKREAREVVHYENYNIMLQLLQKRTIALANVKNYSGSEELKLTDFRLVIINYHKLIIILAIEQSIISKFYFNYLYYFSITFKIFISINI